ncbi:uncharacterized protein BJX67DRAFT_370024 [Aspergillus lucknowensis]|uniref:Uncharacterized protein n=1 Tax=Aspergillus lucknowensis TaxID=176173 RepID=A0ABR4M3R3_9EURO
MASSETHLSSPTPARPQGWTRITKSSPLQDLGPGIMDYERCAALHNELPTRAVGGRGVKMPSKPLTWWEARAPSVEVANSLHTSLTEFLKRAWDEDFPDDLRDRVSRYEDEDEDGRLIKLYESSHFRVGDDEGIIFDQTTLKASFIEDYNDSAPGSYPRFISPNDRRRKVQTISEDQAKLVKNNPSCQVVDQWVIHHYTETDLELAIMAFKRLVEFLKPISNCKVRFQYIAPGLRFPTAPEFQDQPITDFVTSPYNHHGQFPGNCPLRILQIDNAEQRLVAYDRRFGLRNVAAGFYIYPVVPRWPQFWANGCRLLLPFGIGNSGWSRQSNGEPLGVGEYMDENPTPHDAHGDLIADCDWEYLSKLRTLGESREAMPRLVDLLSYLSEPEQEHIWLLLDIKVAATLRSTLSLSANASNIELHRGKTTPTCYALA